MELFFGICANSRDKRQLAKAWFPLGRLGRLSRQSRS